LIIPGFSIPRVPFVDFIAPLVGNFWSLSAAGVSLQR
jgi:hypothetical protein